MPAVYSTKQLAQAVGVHVNTLRFYEQVGFLSKPRRQANGYRVYTDLHLAQCRLIRLAMRAEVLQNGLRSQAVSIVRLVAAGNFDAAYAAAGRYCDMIAAESRQAKAAIRSVEALLAAQSPDAPGTPAPGTASPETASSGTASPDTDLPDGPLLTRRQAARALGLTAETLRTWERSGLVKIKRQANGYRLYAPADCQRLNIIRTLRCANYSLSAILRLLNSLERHSVQPLETILNTPREDEDIICVCDHLLVALAATAVDARRMQAMIASMREDFG